MATMLNGAAVMDAALLLVAANESCPQPQTSEHLAAIEIMKLEHIIILQNKVDLIKESAAQEHYQSILQFVKGTIADSAPIVPISAQLKYNIDAVNEYIVKRIPIPVRDFSSDPRLIVIRSFDVNKPGAEVDSLTGGIAGGSILSGVLRVSILGSYSALEPVLDYREKHQGGCQGQAFTLFFMSLSNSLEMRLRSVPVLSPRITRARSSADPSSRVLSPCWPRATT